MSIRRRRTTERYKDDPLVPISGARLAGALDLEGWSHRELVRRVQGGDAQLRLTAPDVDEIVKGRREQCRSSVRRRIAELVGLSEAFLAGEETDEPVLRAIRQRIKRGGAAAEPPPPWLLASYRLMQQVARAAERDGLNFATAAVSFDIRFLAWASAGSWRSRFLPDYHSPDPALDEATRHLAKAFELILAPWIAGKAAIDQTALAELAGALVPAHREYLIPDVKRPRAQRRPR